jgi:hypothetical protein
MDTRPEGVQYAAAIVSITTGMRDGADYSLWGAITAASSFVAHSLGEQSGISVSWNPAHQPSREFCLGCAIARDAL